jgi:hypothetical protein
MTENTMPQRKEAVARARDDLVKRNSKPTSYSAPRADRQQDVPASSGFTLGDVATFTKQRPTRRAIKAPIGGAR